MTELERETMDLQSVTHLSGRSGRAAKIGALLCFAVACGLLTAPRVGSTKASIDLGGQPRIEVLANR